MVDVLIIGAGTAGCVLAARLSAEPTRSVLLVEAGQDFADRAAMPPALTTGDGVGFDSGGLSATVTAGAGPDRTAGAGQSRRRLRTGQRPGRGPGHAPRLRRVGCPRDATLVMGAEQMLPAYRRCEADRDFPDAPHHGPEGPVPIVRPDRDRLTAPMAAFLESMLDHGHDYQPDMNAPTAVGIGPYPHNQYADGTRASTALTYLAPARGRENLVVRGDTQVDRIVVHHGRAIGVEIGGESSARR